jgi:hypothetical protein
MKTKAVTQQYSMMVEKGLPLDRHPRQQFCLDLSKYITDLKNNGHLILLMGDFKKMLGANSDGMETVAQNRLQHIHLRIHLYRLCSGFTRNSDSMYCGRL